MKKMIRFVVTGEGPTDYGKIIYDESKKIYRWEEGPIFSIIRHTAEKTGKKVELEAVDKKEVERKARMQRSASKLHGLTGKANDSARFSFYLSMQQYEYGIFYCDADKEPGKKNTDPHVCRNRFEQVRREVLEGCEKTGIEGMKLVPMIPLKMIECWLLSDEVAYKILYKIENPLLPRTPELIWGDEKEPKGNYPKNVMRRILSQKRGAEIPMNMETYQQIAEKTDINVLKERCPISFQSFYDDLCNVLKDI